MAGVNSNSLTACSECGIQYLSSKHKACPSCGSKLRNAGEVAREISFSTSLTCPVCNQTDLVQRISTIIDSGTTRTVGFGVSTPMSLHHQASSLLAFGSHSVSNMASRFLPLARPEANFFSNVLYSALLGYFCSFIIMYNWWGDSRIAVAIEETVARDELPLRCATAR